MDSPAESLSLRVLRHLYRKAETLLNEMVWLFSPEGVRSRDRLNTLKGTHRGQRCFVIGNGPSLNKMDLSFLNDEFTIGSNRIYLLFDRVDFRTTYYVAVNRLVIEQCAGEIAQIGCPKFINWNSRDLIGPTPDSAFLRSRPGPKFFPDITRGIWEGSTVTYVAMQLAYHLGFKQVILVGVDHSFRNQGKPHTPVVSTGDDPDHFSPEYFGAGFRWNLPDLKTSEFAYSIAKEWFEGNGREILDATVDGRLDVFPKVEYESLFD